jgi:hypothetical protein
MGRVAFAKHTAATLILSLSKEEGLAPPANAKSPSPFDRLRVRA